MNTNDYLLQSEIIKTGLISVEDLQNETINEWYTILDDNETPDYFKTLIKFFFIPFRVSVLKFQFNSEYIEQVGEFIGLEIGSLFKNYDHIAPSLRLLFQNPFDIPFCYSKWFKICFPDVVLWVIKGEGLAAVKSIVSKRNKDECFTNGTLNMDVLIEIVILYLKTTGKHLECSIIT